MTPKQLQAMKMALDLATMHHTDDGYAELRAKVRSASKEALAQPEQEYRRGDRLVCLETDEYCVIHVAGTDRQWVKFPDTHIGVYTNEQVSELFEKLAKETDLAQPEEEPLHPVHIGVDVTREGTAVTAFYRKPDAVMEMFYSQFHPMAQPEQEPVAWLLTDKNINSLQVDSIQRLIDRLKHAHHTDIRVRINGHDEWFEADWLKHMVRVTPPQPEQNPMSDEMLQAITDPENQPSQYGTVTLDYHFEKIKKWEDLFERLSNKVLQQLDQEPVIDKSAAKRIATALGWTPQRKPLTDEEISEIAINNPPVVHEFARAIEAAHGIKENT